MKKLKTFEEFKTNEGVKNWVLGAALGASLLSCPSCRKPSIDDEILPATSTTTTTPATPAKTTTPATPAKTQWVQFSCVLTLIAYQGGNIEYKQEVSKKEFDCVWVDLYDEWKKWKEKLGFVVGGQYNPPNGQHYTIKLIEYTARKSNSIINGRIVVPPILISEVINN